MEITDSNIKSIIEARMKRDSELFFIDLCYIGNDFGYNYTKRKKYLGLNLNEKIVVAPIFDDVQCLSKNVAALKLENRISVYDIDNREFISQFEYVDWKKDGIYWKLFKISNAVSLYDSERQQFLGDFGYTEYGIRQNYTQYFWAKRGKFFDYINRDTGQVISLPGIIMAYDTQYGMFGKDESGKVSYFEESGMENRLKLRQMVYEAGGYLTLTNLTYKIEDIIDVYGNILNI